MNWTAFLVSFSIWVFFAEHFIWEKRFEQMEKLGFDTPKALITTSNIISGAALLNLLVFFAVYGFRIGWLQSLAIVLGGWVATLVLQFVLRLSPGGTFLHKMGWIGMPAMSVAIWLVAF